jgi:hypothetical protein
MGFAWLQGDGRSPFKALSDSCDKSVSSPPFGINASVASTPGPPALVTIVSRGLADAAAVPFGVRAMAGGAVLMEQIRAFHGIDKNLRLLVLLVLRLRCAGLGLSCRGGGGK